MIKKRYLVIFMALLIVGISVATAADVDDTNNTQIIKDTTNTQITTETTTTDDNTINAIETEQKYKTINKKENTENVKTAKNYNLYLDNINTTFPNGVLKSSVNDGDSLTFKEDISTTGQSFIINKAVNIIGNNHTFNINTGLNYAKTSLNFITSASNSNVTNLNLLNTQVYVNTSSNITFDNIHSKVTNTGVGAGVGSFAIRDGSINITVKNSKFETINNGGYSTIVLTWAKNCTIDNNTITGTGNVGNLVYLNNYGGKTNANNITNNSGNVISNNVIAGPNPGTMFCYSVVISGPNNTVINNNITNYGNYAVTTIWSGSYDNTTDPEDTHNVTYFGNKYLNNRITGSFSTGNYSIVENNVITGTSNIVGHANVTNNNFIGNVNLQNDVNFKNNNVTDYNVYVKLANCHIKDSNIKLLNVSTVANPTYNCTGNTITEVNDTNGNLVNCTGNYVWAQSSSNQLTIKKNNIKTKKESSIEQTEIVSTIYIDNMDDLSSMMSEAIPFDYDEGEYLEAPTTIIINFDCDPKSGDFCLPPKGDPDQIYDITLNNLEIHNGVISYYYSSKQYNITYNNFTFTYDDNYFWETFDENGWPTGISGISNFVFLGETKLINSYMALNMTEDNVYAPDSEKTYFNTLKDKPLILENCTIDLGLPEQKEYFNSRDYTLQFKPIQIFGNTNLIVKNCTFNIFCTSENEDITTDNMPCFINMTTTDHTITFTNNTINLNNVKGFILDSNNAIIENNTITTNYDYAVELTGTGNTVRNNKLISKELKGDEAVLDKGEGNTIENNGPAKDASFKVIAPENANINEATPITIMFMDNNGALISNEIITISLGEDVLETSTTDVNGMVIYNFTPTTDGEVTLTIKHEETGYIETNTSVTINVHEDKDAIIKELNDTINRLTAAKNTSILFDDIGDVKYNTNVTISGMLINEDSISLSNQVVTLTFGDKSVNVTTRNGEFRYTTSFKTLESQTVTATFEGNDKYLESTATTSFDITKGDVIVTFDSIQDVKYGENVTITGKFTTSDGKAISNSNVKVLINGKKYYAKTDKTGKFTLSAKITKTGENNITIGYSGNNNYNAYEINTTVNAEKQDVIVTYDVVDSVKKGDNVTITGTFKDANGNAVKNSNVKIIINGKKYYAKTDSTGAFTFTTPLKTLGDNNVTIGYSGNTNYNSYESVTTIKVTD